MTDEQRYVVTLLSVDGRPIAVAKAIREIRTDLNPQAAKTLTQVLPVTIATDLDYEQAQYVVDVIRGGGGRCAIDPPRIVPDKLVVDFQSWLIRPVSRDEVEQSPAWQSAAPQMESGDEIWFFRSPPIFWERMCGREGYALLRNGETVASVVTAMN